MSPLENLRASSPCSKRLTNKDSRFRTFPQTRCFPVSRQQFMVAYQHNTDDVPMDEQEAAQTVEQQQKGDQEETEGFTRSISLYWNWVRGQKAAARVGKGIGHNSTALILQCEHWLEAADCKHRYGTNLRPYFDVWLNQQARGRSDALPAHQSYIPYSAIPEIAAQAAAEAEAAISQAANNNNAEPGALPPAGAAAAAGSSFGDGSSSGDQQQQQQQQQLRHEALPATPRRSRSAPNLADLHSIDEAVQMHTIGEAEQNEEVQEEATADVDAAADVREQQQCSSSSSSVVRTVAPHAASFTAGSSSSSSKFHQQLQPAVSAFLSFVGRGHGSSSLPGIHTDDRFFYWLDEGSGRHVDLADRGVARSKLESERVQYLTESERNQLQVTVDRSSGRLVYVVSGKTVHTGSELSLVQLRPSEQGAAAAAAAAAVAVDSSGPCAAACCNEVVLVPDRSLQPVPEVAAEEEEEEEEEEEQQEDEVEAGSTQKHHRQLQRQQLQQMQQTIRQPQQQQQQPGLQIQQSDGQQESAAASAEQQQQQQHQEADADVIMEDDEAGTAADLPQQLFCTPNKLAAAAVSSAGAAAPAGTATPSAAAYGSVAGQATPGTTGFSQRRRAPLLSAEQQQQQQDCDASLQQQSTPQHQQSPHLQLPVNGSSQQQHQPVAGLLKIKEKPCKWIYVLDTSKRLFVHAKYRGKFHHSSFLQGGAVLAAGGIVVERGRIMKLTADSGHYRPNFESFMSTVQMLKDMGADLTQTKLSAKHIKCPQLPETGPS